MTIALSLIAVALGYRVFTDARKEKAAVRLLGLVLGTFVIVMAVASVVCSTLKCMSDDNCPIMMNKSLCPMMKTDAKPALPS